MRTQTHDGVHYVSVTSAMRLVKRILDEPEDCYGPPALAKIHALEGEGCHRICLDWLAHEHGWLSYFTPPPKPEGHPDLNRWLTVTENALVGFKDFCQQYGVHPLAIEQEAFDSARRLVGHADLFATLRNGLHRAETVVDLKFVNKVLPSHLIQVRTYARLKEFRTARMGAIFHGNRETGAWAMVPVNLTEGLHDVEAVACAARLWAWSQER